ncbi:ABC transporter permease [Streptomyces sp. TLI_171]|uniref:ABC transporter permease n=1 Tax=Streptomyces sp. TLI_171 TaxID=1938859 RepID=UPI000C184AB8|nr:ABC transporter permease [Streptomyces sp. TLI_171]RKE17538.1 ABC-2 type transport system permease protein [Streptomyces sp. TLI_171]
MNAYTAVTRASYLAYLRDRTSVIFTFAFPLLFLIVFGALFQGQSVDGGLSYINYIAPGVLSWGIGNAALFGVAFTLMHWRRDDLLRLIWRTPTPLPTVLGARYAVALGTGVVQALLFTVVAVAAFGLHLSGSWPLALPVLLFGITAFAALGLVVGTLANTSEAVAAIANCVMVPMAFLSGAFYPIDLMPGWLQGLSRALPLRYFDEGVTDAVGGRGGDLLPFLDCAALAGFTVVLALIAARTFRWSNRN